MSETQVLTPKAPGDPIIGSDINELQNAVNGDFVGRSTGGIPTALQRLGTPLVPWNQIYGSSLFLNGVAIDTTLIEAPDYRILSGITRRDVQAGFSSDFPLYLIPGSGNTLQIDASSVPLVFEIKGTQHTLSSDITLTPLALAGDPSLATNRALVNDTGATGQDTTRTYGEYRTRGITPIVIPEAITIDTIGGNFAGKDQSFQVFRNGGELFLGFLDGTLIRQCFRGYYYGNSLLPIRRETFSNNDVIELMQAHWLFLDKDLITVDITLKSPIYEFSEPPGVVGDYWFDLKTNQWNRHNGASFVPVDRIYIGTVVSDDVGVIGARPIEYFGNYKRDNNISLARRSAATMELESTFMDANIGGRRISYGPHKQDWDIGSDLVITNNDSYAASEQASTFYYMYIGDQGEEIVSDMEPYFRGELFGWYHPFHIWRCFGRIFNDSGSDFTSDTCDIDNTVDLPNTLIDGKRDIRCRSIPGDMIEQNGIDDAEIAFNTISPAKLKARVQNQSSVTTGGVIVSVTPVFTFSTGHTTDITVDGTRPVMIIIGYGTGGGHFLCLNGDFASNERAFFVRVQRTTSGGLNVGTYDFSHNVPSRNCQSGFVFWDPSPPVGLQTYRIELAVAAGTLTRSIQAVSLAIRAIEM